MPINATVSNTLKAGFATVSPIQSNIGLAFDAVLQDDRLLAALHNEHHGLHFGLPHFPSGARQITTSTFISLLADFTEQRSILIICDFQKRVKDEAAEGGFQESGDILKQRHGRMKKKIFINEGS